mmetsp:Transcript_31955/g.69779  ORF Transcript_31955/g.69779 Transcript_31955/m.69779 type:complete len:214 (-) Transcript_31955:124-765(-)
MFSSFVAFFQKFTSRFFILEKNGSLIGISFSNWLANSASPASLCAPEVPVLGLAPSRETRPPPALEALLASLSRLALPAVLPAVLPAMLPGLSSPSTRLVLVGSAAESVEALFPPPKPNPPIPPFSMSPITFDALLFFSNVFSTTFIFSSSTSKASKISSILMSTSIRQSTKPFSSSKRSSRALRDPARIEFVRACASQFFMPWVVMFEDVTY